MHAHAHARPIGRARARMAHARTQAGIHAHKTGHAWLPTQPHTLCRPANRQRVLLAMCACLGMRACRVAFERVRLCAHAPAWACNGYSFWHAHAGCFWPRTLVKKSFCTALRCSSLSYTGAAYPWSAASFQFCGRSTLRVSVPARRTQHAAADVTPPHPQRSNSRSRNRRQEGAAPVIAGITRTAGTRATGSRTAACQRSRRRCTCRSHTDQRVRRGRHPRAPPCAADSRPKRRRSLKKQETKFPTFQKRQCGKMALGVVQQRQWAVATRPDAHRDRPSG